MSAQPSNPAAPPDHVTIEIDGVPMFAVRSGGMVFPVMPAAELDALSR